MNFQLLFPITALTTAFVLSACQPTTPVDPETGDDCGASQLQHLVGGPSHATADLDVPESARHYGVDDLVTTDFSPARLNFVHSSSGAAALTDPASTVIRIYCG